METKYITVSFDIERAKRIINGEEKGEIVTRDGRKARIVCWDAKDDFPIIALISNGSKEVCESFTFNGLFMPFEEKVLDLFLSVPENNTEENNSSNIVKEYKFEPFDKVLVRDDCTTWNASFFSHCNEEYDSKFITTAALNWKYCIPYNEQTKHLVGTNKDWEG